MLEKFLRTSRAQYASHIKCVSRTIIGLSSYFIGTSQSFSSPETNEAAQNLDLIITLLNDSAQTNRSPNSSFSHEGAKERPRKPSGFLHTAYSPAENVRSQQGRICDAKSFPQLYFLPAIHPHPNDSSGCALLLSSSTLVQLFK